MKYNKSSDIRIDNFEYSDIQAMSDKNGEKNYSEMDLSSYIEEIEDNISLYQNTDYLEPATKMITLGKAETIVTIPEEQKKFKHWIDKKNSKNLHLVEGISESDFESFETLTIVSNAEFNGEEVQIAFKKGFYDSTEVDSTAISANNVQYKELIGMKKDYELRKKISVKVKDATEDECEEDEEGNTNNSGNSKCETKEDECEEDGEGNTNNGQGSTDDNVEGNTGNSACEHQKDGIFDVQPGSGAKDPEIGSVLPNTGESISARYAILGAIILLGMICYIPLRKIKKC